MKIHEIERHQTHPEHLEITLYLDPDLLWFKGHFAVQPLLRRCTTRLGDALRYHPDGTGLPFSQHSECEVCGPAVAGQHGDADPDWHPARQMLSFSYQRHAGSERHTASSGKIRLSVTFRPCVLIPCYNHGAMMAAVLARLAPFDLPCRWLTMVEEHAPHRRT